MRIILFGDSFGIPELLRAIPEQHIVALVAAGIRPQCLPFIQSLAIKHGVPLVIQPKVTENTYPEFVKAIADLKPDLYWIHSYSMIIRPEVIKIAVHGGLNLHYAPLPKYRGCNPIQWSLINNEKQTAVTLHEISKTVDEGAIIDQAVLPINLCDTAHSIMNSLHQLSHQLIKKNLEQILSRKWTSKKQNNEAASCMRRRTPADGRFIWDEPIIDIYNKVRALLPPLPPAFFIDDDGQAKEILTFRSLAEIAIQKLQRNPINFKRGQEVLTLSAHARTSRDCSDIAPDKKGYSFELSLLIENKTSVIARAKLKNLDWQSGRISAELELYRNTSDTDCIKLISKFCKQELKLEQIEPYVLNYLDRSNDFREGI